MSKIFVILILILAAIRVLAQDSLLRPTIKPYANIQFWNVSSYDFVLGEEQMPDRMASYFRRGRIGLKGEMNEKLSYDVMMSFDYLGKSENLSSKGKVNPNAISLWSFYFTYQALAKSQWLMVTGGTFLPHLSRESVTSPWTTSSLDKAETSCYLRQFVTGKTNGICPGINIGGLGDIGKVHLLYNVATINRQDKLSITKNDLSPLFIGHIVWSIGDKESSTYKYIFSGNSLKKQKLFSFGMGVSKQGKTDIFQSSSTYGADFLMVLNGFKIDSEYYYLDRKNTSSYLASCFMLRISHNFFMKKKWVIEPCVMISQFKGDDSYQDASFFDGEDNMSDVGLNLIAPKHQMKIALHYIYRYGEAAKNHRVTSSGTYGDYLNLGIQLKI